jgi:hypothetical protein
MPRGGDARDSIWLNVAGAFVFEAIATPVIVYLMQRATGKRLDAFDRKREDARRERDAERAIVLAIARTMLLDNFEQCVRKGYYTVEEREVYGKLYAAYTDDGGNGVIATVAERIRDFPLEPPMNLNEKGGKQ